VDSRRLAIALVSMNERVQYATFAGEPPSLPDEAVTDVLLSIWLKAIYGKARFPED
jgi:TetR/AcrR family transcriptional regulator, ethionamide resistance regulator